jgi:hypothetical protein
MSKVKVFNKNKFDVGIRLINPQREQNIKAGSFTIIDEEDVYYLDSISTIFKRGILVVDNDVINENIGCTSVKESILSDSEIITLLRLSFTKMKQELSKIVEPHIIDSVYRVAKVYILELSGAKIKYLTEFTGKDIMA